VELSYELGLPRTAEFTARNALLRPTGKSHLLVGAIVARALERWSSTLRRGELSTVPAAASDLEVRRRLLGAEPQER
jgi:hypothetical protein